MKAKALADSLDESTITAKDSSPLPPSWSIYVDGSSTKDGIGAGLIIESPPGERHEHALKLMFKESNNEAEYEALDSGNRIVLYRRCRLGPSIFELAAYGHPTQWGVRGKRRYYDGLCSADTRGHQVG